MTRPLAILTLFVALLVYHPATAQVQPDAFSERLHIGRGAVLDAQWHPGGNLILVNTVTGAWLYSDTMADVAYLPGIRLARFSKDGTVVAGIDSANQLTMWGWNNNTFTQFAAYPSDMAYVTALEWSPDGTQIATLDRIGRILVWDIVSAVFQFEVQLNGATQIAWRKGGSYLAAINAESQTFVVWDKTGKLILQEKPAYDLQSGAVEWRNDTQLLQILYSVGQTGQLWDVPTQKPLWEQERDLVYFSAFSPDGSKLAVSGIDAVSIRDAETGTILSVIDGPQWAEIAWSPDGEYVAFGDRTIPQTENATTFIVDATTGIVTKELNSHNSGVQQIYWSPDGTRLLTVYDNQEMSISSTNPQVSTYSGYGSIAHTDIGETLDWNADGTRIVAADTYDGARLWDAETGDVLTFRMNMMSQPATKIAWQPGGTLVATTSDDGWRGMYHNVYIWDTANPQQELKPVTVIPHVHNIRGFAWNPDGESLVTAERSWFLHVWKPDDPDTVQTLDIRPLIGDGSGITGIAWSYKGDIVVIPNSGSTAGAIALIDVASQTLLPDHHKEPQSDGIDGLLAWAWTPTNQFVGMRWGSYTGAGAYDFLIQILYDPASAAAHNAITLSELPKPGTKAILSPLADKVIGFDQANDAIIWDLQPQSLRARLYGVNDAVWSPDESMLVTYGVDGVLRVVDATTGDILHTFDDHFNADYPRISVFWSPDSRKTALLDRGVVFIYEKTG